MSLRVLLAFLFMVLAAGANVASAPSDCPRF